MFWQLLVGRFSSMPWMQSSASFQKVTSVECIEIGAEKGLCMDGQLAILAVITPESCLLITDVTWELSDDFSDKKLALILSVDSAENKLGKFLLKSSVEADIGK
jgi:hypothetical protein